MEYKRFGVMLDVSRNGVMKISHVKKYIDYLARMGYNTLELYAEDLYEIQAQRGTVQNGIDPRLMALLNHISEQLDKLTELRVYLNSGALVGELLPAIDGRMADRWNHALRGNTR